MPISAVRDTVTRRSLSLFLCCPVDGHCVATRRLAGISVIKHRILLCLRSDVQSETGGVLIF